MSLTLIFLKVELYNSENREFHIIFFINIIFNIIFFINITFFINNILSAS